MEINFTKTAWEDFSYWMETDLKTAKKIKDLLHAIRKNPFSGIGKPEPLKFGLKGYWSRRINHEHRLVYAIIGDRGKEQRCVVLQWRYHYA